MTVEATESPAPTTEPNQTTSSDPRDAELNDLRARLETHEKQAEELERARGEWSKVDERRAKTIEGLKSENKALQDQIAKLNKAEEARIRREREDRFVAKVGEKLNLSETPAIRGLLREAAELDSTIDIAPEQLTDKAIEAAAKAITKLSPTLFGERASIGGPPGRSNPTKGMTESQHRTLGIVQKLNGLYNPRKK